MSVRYFIHEILGKIFYQNLKALYGDAIFGVPLKSKKKAPGNQQKYLSSSFSSARENSKII